MAGLRTNRSVVVSGGGSAATGLGYKPRSPAVPASVNPLRNLRRLNCRAYWVLIGTSIPDTGQCDTSNAGQWTLLPLHEQVQHLTLSRHPTHRGYSIMSVIAFLRHFVTWNALIDKAFQRLSRPFDLQDSYQADDL
jgi:hypothetical protein